jgi:hypothetical protein
LAATSVAELPVSIDKVTLDAARAAAKARLDPDHVAVVIVGRAAAIAPELEAAGWRVERTDIRQPIGARPAATVDAAKAVAGRRLLDAALAAQGGAERLLAIKDVHAVGSVRLSAGGREVSGRWESWLVPPDRRRVEIRLGGRATVTTVAGDAVWQESSGRADDIPDAVARAERQRLWRDPSLVLLRHLDPATVVVAAGTERLGRHATDAVLVRSADGANEVEVDLDPESHQIRRLSYQEGGAPAVEDYDDFRAVGGVWFAFRQRVARGAQAIEVTIADLQVNAGVPAGLFVRPK